MALYNKLYCKSIWRNFLVYLEGTLYPWIAHLGERDIRSPLLRVGEILCLLTMGMKDLMLIRRCKTLPPTILRTRCRESKSPPMIFDCHILELVCLRIVWFYVKSWNMVVFWVMYLSFFFLHHTWLYIKSHNMVLLLINIFLSLSFCTLHDFTSNHAMWFYFNPFIVKLVPFAPNMILHKTTQLGSILTNIFLSLSFHTLSWLGIKQCNMIFTCFVCLEKLIISFLFYCPTPISNPKPLNKEQVYSPSTWFFHTLQIVVLVFIYIKTKVKPIKACDRTT